MAIDQGTVTATVKKSDRTWRVEMYLDDDLLNQLVFHREIRVRDSETNEVVSRDRQSIPSVKRVSAQVAQKSYTASGITATGQQILALVNKMTDVERQVDIDTPPVIEPPVPATSPPVFGVSTGTLETPPNFIPAPPVTGPVDPSAVPDFIPAPKQEES